jgi:tryptophan synthase alpha subunit
MKTIKIKGKQYPRVWLGTSPFIGAGQFGLKAQQFYQQFYETPENMLEIMIRAAELGWGIQPFALPKILTVLHDLRTEHPEVPLMFMCGVGDFKSELDRVVHNGAQGAGLHAGITDQLSPGEREAFLSIVRHEGLVTGLATHSPARHLPEMIDSSADFLFVPINKTGKFMGEKVRSVYKLIKGIKKPVIAKKVFGAGEISPEDAIPFVLAHNVNAVCLGVTSIDELEQNHEILTNLEFI